MLSTDLKIGVISANFNLSGKIPSFIQELNILESIGAQISLFSFLLDYNWGLLSVLYDIATAINFLNSEKCLFVLKNAEKWVSKRSAVTSKQQKSDFYWKWRVLDNVEYSLSMKIQKHLRTGSRQDMGKIFKKYHKLVFLPHLGPTRFFSKSGYATFVP